MKQSRFLSSHFAFWLLFCALSGLKAQTFFETAKDDGIISFAQNTMSQIKLNLSTTAISYGYNYLSGDISAKTRLVINGEIKAKPSDDGVATLMKTGSLQPGLKANGAIGVRLNDRISSFFSAFDLAVKPSYELNSFTIYDSIRGTAGMDPVYKASKGSFALNGLINGVLSPGKINIFFGLQYGVNWTNNGDDLSKGVVQTVSPYAGSTVQTLSTNIKEVKYGQLEGETKSPFKADLIFDPGWELNHNDATNIRLGFFGYFRTDGQLKKYRNGFGICFLDKANPSKIVSSLGYELPAFGDDVKSEARKQDSGVVFFSIGYSIF